MNLVCFNIQIRIDKEGRYCLNDIHSAAISSGVTKDIRPNEWLSLKNTQRKAEILNRENGCNYAIASKAGRYGGTYACKELAIAFTLWIDETVFLKIVKAIDDLAIIQEALNNFEVPDDIPDMYVYAIKNTDTGNIKLGISKNPEQRLKQLQTGCDGKLELVAYRKADNGYRDELQLHTENEQHAIHGEWFTSDAKFN